MRLICPPVSPMSPLAEIREWVATLEQRIEAADEDDRADYQRALDEARRWIRMRDETGQVPNLV